jgi:hypothetical protein
MSKAYLSIGSAIVLMSIGSLSAQSPSPSPNGTRREAIAVLKSWGVLHGKIRVHSISPFGDHWLVALRYPDGSFENYSVETITKECGPICHH